MNFKNFKNFIVKKLNFIVANACQKHINLQPLDISAQKLNKFCAKTELNC